MGNGDEIKTLPTDEEGESKLFSFVISNII